MNHKMSLPHGFRGYIPVTFSSDIDCYGTHVIAGKVYNISVIANERNLSEAMLIVNDDYVSIDIPENCYNNSGAAYTAYCNMIAQKIPIIVDGNDVVATFETGFVPKIAVQNSFVSTTVQPLNATLSTKVIFRTNTLTIGPITCADLLIELTRGVLRMMTNDATSIIITLPDETNWVGNVGQLCTLLQN